MSRPLRVFALRGTYVFTWEASLPAALEEHYNAAEDRYELPEEELVERLDAAVDAEVAVEPAEAFTVEFLRTPPNDLLAKAVFVERTRGRTRLLLPTADAVEQGLTAGGTRLSV